MNDRGFWIWFTFCGLVLVALLGTAVYLVIELWPHLIGMIDRIGQ